MYIDSEYICSHCRTKKSKEMEQGEGNNKLVVADSMHKLRGHKRMLMGTAGDVGITSVTSQVLLIELETA